MEWELALNVRETLTDIVEISKVAAEGGIRRLWIIDFPATRLAPIVASAVAENTEDCRIGIGLISPLLHRPSQIVRFLDTLAVSYGDRFDLLVGPGDREMLRKVGVDTGDTSTIVERVSKFTQQIRQGIEKIGHCVRIWIGAQGPKMIRSSASADGVLLNYSDPDMVKWAIDEIGNVRSGFQIGVFPPSHIVEEKQCDDIRYQISAAVVALGLTRSVAERFGLAEVLRVARKVVRNSGRVNSETIRVLGNDVIQRFGLCGTAENLCDYTKRVADLGVDVIAFGPPMGTTLKQVQALVNALRECVMVP